MKKLFAFILVCCMYGLHAENVLHDYLWANYLQYGGKTESANKLYQQVLPHSVYSYPGYIHLLYNTDEYQKIVDLIPKIGTQFDQDPTLQLMIIDALNKTGHSADAYSKLETLYKKFPYNTQVVFARVNFAIAKKDLKNALDILNALLNNVGPKSNLFIFHFMKAQIYLKLNNPQQALASVKESLALYDQFDKGWLMRAMLEEQLGQVEHAIQGYTTYLELTGGSNKQISDHLLQLAFRQKLKQQNKKTAFVQQTCFEQTVALFEQKRYKQALAHIDHCLMQKPDSTKGRLLKIEILTAMGQFNQAAAHIQAWIDKDPHNQLWFDALHLLARQGAQHNTIIKTLQTLHTKYPTSLWAPLYLADLHARAHNTSEALIYLNKAYTITNDTALKVKLLFQQGVLHFEQRQFDKMVQILEQGYALDKTHAPLLNLLAHHYATKGNNIARASELINAACTQDPHNPHIIDTKALIMYKQKQYTNAHQLLTKLHKENPQDATILIHLAQVEHKQNHIDVARSLLQNAQTLTHAPYEKQKITSLTKKLTPR